MSLLTGIRTGGSITRSSRRSLLRVSDAGSSLGVHLAGRTTEEPQLWLGFLRGILDSLCLRLGGFSRQKSLVRTGLNVQVLAPKSEVRASRRRILPNLHRERPNEKVKCYLDYILTNSLYYTDTD